MKMLKLNTSDYLQGCANFLASLKPFMRLRKTAAGIECQMTLADGRAVKVVGKDEPNLLLNVMTALVSFLPESEISEQLKTGSVSSCASSGKKDSEATMVHEQRDAQPVSTKETIGLTTKVSMHRLVKDVAKSRGVSITTAARDLLHDGIKLFDKESRTESPSELLREYERKANSYAGAESESWVVRADRHLVMKTQVRAQEFGGSLSSFANFVMAQALEHCEVAAALRGDVTSTSVSEAAISDAVEVIKRSCGPRAGKLATEIGLGEQRVLASMILGGTVLAPTRVLSKLAEALQLPLQILSLGLERRFRDQPVPAFKAVDAKPEVSTERKAWAAAVKELQLSSEEEERLLNLEG